MGSRALLRQPPSVAAHLAALRQENPAAEGPMASGRARGALDAAVAGSPLATDAAAAAAPLATPACAEPATPAGPMPTGPHRCARPDPPNGAQGRTNDLAVSRTDPAAGLLSREGVPLALQPQVRFGVEGGTARAITAGEVTPGDLADEELLDRICKEHGGTTGRTVAEVTADAGYGTAVNRARLEAQGKRAGIPPHTGGDQGRAVPREPVAYQTARGRYACPQGQPLTRQGISCTGAATRSII